MPLSKDALRILDYSARLSSAPLETLTVEQARALSRETAKMDGDPPPVARWEDRMIPGPGGEVPVRVYWPRDLREDERIPVVIFLHGGGWVLASVSNYDACCRRLANAAQCVVVSVEYRLAPEHRFPAAVDDGYAVLRWLKDNAPHIGGDRRKIAVMGDSAGGNLAAVLCLKSRDLNGPPICAQVLIYPVTDHWDAGYASYAENAEGYGLTRASMIWFWAQYLGPDGDRRNPYAAPLRASYVANLPPALVLSAEYDPLRDEARAYADRLEEAGNIVQRKHYEGQIHGFFRCSAMTEDADDAMRESSVFLNRVWKAL